MRRFLVVILGAAAVVLLCVAAALAAFPFFDGHGDGVRVQGGGVPPQLGFACCERGLDPMRGFLADPGVIDSLKDLRAEVAIPILDFLPERAEAVHRLNQAGIPAIAWIMLPKEQGFYLNAENAPEAEARVAAFEKWSSENSLKWAAVGLDVEPNFAEFAALKGHPWRLIATLLHRCLDGQRNERARQAYSSLIREIQSRGYPVQTYQMPYLPAERSVHSSLLDRMLGTVDVRGNEEYLMLYTSFARPVGAAMIWSLGRNTQAIAVGVTDGDTPAGSGNGPLDWNEFSRDLIVASHYTNLIGVYDLEGCARQGFLARLKTMDWSQSVLIPAGSVRRAERLGLVLRTVLWIGSHFLYLFVAALLLLVGLIVRWRIRKTRMQPD